MKRLAALACGLGLVMGILVHPVERAIPNKSPRFFRAQGKSQRVLKQSNFDTIFCPTTFAGSKYVIIFHPRPQIKSHIFFQYSFNLFFFERNGTSHQIHSRSNNGVFTGSSTINILKTIICRKLPRSSAKINSGSDANSRSLTSIFPRNLDAPTQYFYDIAASVEFCCWDNIYGVSYDIGAVTQDECVLSVLKRSIGGLGTFISGIRCDRSGGNRAFRHPPQSPGEQSNDRAGQGSNNGIILVKQIKPFNAYIIKKLVGGAIFIVGMTIIITIFIVIWQNEKYKK